MKRTLKLLSCLLLFGIFQQVLADIPIVSHRYLADPGSLVYNGRVYLYCSNDDENPPTDDGGYQMSSIVCISSSDLKNWTDHGIVFQVPRDASWAANSWAPTIAERNGQFYLYFGNGGNGIGVATADSPVGPFVDPLGERLISSETPGVLPAENLWLFDPMTFIDDDGQAYVYFGGNGEDNLRVIRLNEDMISLDGSATQFHVPYFFEAAWMHKHNGTYYFSYSTNPSNGMRIDYLTSDNPTTGFTYGGIVSPQPPDNNNNNHQAIFEFKGTWYEAYHNRYVAAQEGIPATYRRNICLDSFYHQEDGSIVTMVNTVDGLPQVGYVDPYVRVEAETMDAQTGIYTEVCSEGGMALNKIEHGDWVKVRGVDFGLNGPATFTASVASEMKYGDMKGGAIEVRIDGVDGTLIGTVAVSYTGGPDQWKPETISTEEITGIHDVYFVFTGGDDENLFYFDYWFFTEKTASADLAAINAIVADYKIDTLPGNDSTLISVTAIYTDGTSVNVVSETSYSLDQEGIVSVSDSVIRGLDYGEVTITASYNGMTDSVKLVVKNIPGELTVIALQADTPDMVLNAGTSSSVIITAEYADGHVEDVTAQAEYNSPNPEIATVSMGQINALTEGEVDIIVSFQGELGDAQTLSVHVTVSSGAGVWLEAECGSAGSLWDIKTNSNASHGQYITVQTGNNSTDAAPDDSGLLSFTFDVEVNSSYTLYTRVMCPSANDDSFWLRMDNGSWAMWNGIAGSSSWTWTSFPTSYELSAGTHTLTIGYREDGALLDKLWISTNADAVLTDLGADAENCPEDTSLVSDHVQAVQLFPNPVEEVLNIALPDAPAEVGIFTAEGKKVFSGRYNSGTMNIDMAGYKPGIYLVRITSQGNTLMRKIIHTQTQP
ncbi:MAG: family 43 glycosylhydrolase [Bacteroidales bacterium]|nr:family 43 glycosylhydrolase [Bacteroidales bacterium]